MLASFGSGSPFWASFKSKSSNHDDSTKSKHNNDSDSITTNDSKIPSNNSKHQPSPEKSPATANFPTHTLGSINSSSSPTGSSFNPMLMPETSYDDLFPSSMELLVLDELVSQLRSKIAEESANNARSSFSLNRSSSTRSRPRPLSGMGIGALTAAGTSSPKRHSRSLSRSSVLSIDSVASAATDNKCYELYPYCEVVGEHIIKLAENATHWTWAMNCFNNLSQIYSTLDSLFLDKSPALYTMTITSLLACHMCKALQMRGSTEFPNHPSTASETVKKHHNHSDTKLGHTTNTHDTSLSGNSGSLLSPNNTNNSPTIFSTTKSHRRSKSSVSAIPSIVNKGGTLEFTEAEPDGHEKENHAHVPEEPVRKLNKKELEQLNSDLCDHILSAFSTLVTSQSHSSTLNLVLGQTIVYILGNIHLNPKFVKAFFEKLRSSQRLFWYPRSQVLRQWRLYWLQVIMDRMVVYTNYFEAQHGGSTHNSSHDSKHHNNTKDHSSASNSNRNSHIIHPPQHNRNPSISSINFTLENLNLYSASNGGNRAGNTNSVVSTATNDSEATGVTSTSSGSSTSPALSTTSTMLSNSNGLPITVSDLGDVTDENTIVEEEEEEEEEEYEPNPYLLPANNHDIPTLANIKKIVSSCIDELFVGDETDVSLKQHTENVFKINGQT